MFESKKRRLQAVNYNVVLDLLNYSQAKLFEKRDLWDQFIFIDELVNTRKSALSVALGVTEEQVETVCRKVVDAYKIETDYSVTTVKDDNYPTQLRLLERPPLVLLTRGRLELANTRCISVVGSRQASPEGRMRAQKLAILLADNGYTVVSGLAQGIDTAAHTATIKAGGNTIAVIGTTLSESYPKENTLLQEKIAAGHLLVSQFPFAQETKPFNFPARNYTMCGLSIATVVVEASETSGALYQARYCIQENRQLFVMKSLLENPQLKWPRNFVKRGAIVLDNFDTLLSRLNNIVEPAKTPAIEQLHLFV